MLLSINACTPAADCGNGVQDVDETAIDCGGSDCPACVTCSDGIMNGSETAIDCGGSCAACPGSFIKGTYSGKTTGPMVIFYDPAVDVDTIFTAPDIATTYEILDHIDSDSINVKLKMIIDGTPISIKVPAHIDSETTFSITNYEYTYLVINMIINGTGLVNGNNLTTNMIMSNGSGNPAGTIVTGDLDFTGTK